ncbi:unnamed protein product [Blepharisma stoltei]|uniref:Ubiquitin-like domain-containing protein n=1 Tax=Blepharisma stoltei TaxID=1481888 RepID=A0AAU9KJX7_9CILI|nr:unnamed protein product [Blepharisma stoltei]
MPCRIILKPLEKCEVIEVHNGKSIRWLKLYIRNKFGIPIRNQTWHLENKIVWSPANYNWPDINIKDNDTITVTPYKVGGGFALAKLYDFNNFENRIEIDFSETAPPWRHVRPGICFIGQCKNENCEECYLMPWIWSVFFDLSMLLLPYGKMKKAFWAW